MNTNQNLVTTSETAFTPPPWLLGHSPSHPVDATKEEVQTALAAARREVEIAGPEVLAALLAKYLVGFPIPEGKAWKRDFAPLYLEVLKDLPPDLLARGLIQMRKTHSYNSLPKEADIRKSVEAALVDRHATVGRLESMLTIGKFKEPPREPRSQADKDEVADMVAKAVAHLSTPWPSSRNEDAGHG